MSKTIRSIQTKEKKRRAQSKKSKREISKHQLLDGMVETDVNERYYLKINQ